MQVAQKVGRRRGLTQREGKKPKPQGRVYLEYPSNPVTAKEGSIAARRSICYGCLDIAAKVASMDTSRLCLSLTEQSH